MADEMFAPHIGDDKKKEQEINELFKTAEESIAGPQEVIEEQISTPIGNLTIHSLHAGFRVDENGTWIKEKIDRTTPLACGCRQSETIVLCSYSHEPICTQHALYCVKCSRPVWAHFAEVISDEIYCKACVEQTRLKRFFSSCGRYALTIMYGLGGKDYNEVNPPGSKTPMGSRYGR